MSRRGPRGSSGGGGGGGGGGGRAAGRKGSCGGARGCSYTNSPIKYNGAPV